MNLRLPTVAFAVTLVMSAAAAGTPAAAVTAWYRASS